MSNIKIAIIDRDTEALERFREMLTECLKTIGMQHCELIIDSRDDDSFIQQYEPGQYFLVIIDIQQRNSEGMDGIEHARKIREKDLDVPIVFISSVNDYATETYQLGANYFVLKPLDMEKCYQILYKVIYKRCSEKWQISFPDGFQCRLGEIVYIRQVNKKSIVYLDNQHYYEGGITMDMLEQMLRVYGCLFRIDKETIINLSCIETMERKALLMTNNHYITVSKKQMKEIREQQINLHIRQAM